MAIGDIEQAPENLIKPGLHGGFICDSGLAAAISVAAE